MLIRPAEESYHRGVEAFSEGRRLEAMALFEAAIELDKQFGAARAQARYLSYYGLCLALESHRVAEGVALCREATALEFYNPELYCNLGRVLIAARRRHDAYQALRQGLRLERGHPGIVRELRGMGRRRRPVFPFLSRRNPINVLLGRLTYSRKPASHVGDTAGAEARGDQAAAGA